MLRREFMKWVGMGVTVTKPLAVPDTTSDDIVDVFKKLTFNFEWPKCYLLALRGLHRTHILAYDPTRNLWSSGEFLVLPPQGLGIIGGSYEVVMQLIADADRSMQMETRIELRFIDGIDIVQQQIDMQQCSNFIYRR